ncbi:hypothetical protein ACI2K4_06140 [Micromonospora sp. NPDC050397]|uniref:hypothetical protein n=1 Tax=Micromonospora sp. NPDC050397 TaxID=3364279 RepID=UPI00384B444B
MRRPRQRLTRLTTVATLVLTVLAVLPSATPAAAAGVPFYGDVTGDGYVDQIIPGNTSDRCTLSVYPGDSIGRFGAPTAHPYVLPEAEPGTTHCPDDGTVIDIGGDGTVEIVLVWCCAPPVDYGLLIMRNFQPVGTMPGEWEHDRIGTANFNGDSLADLYTGTYFGGFNSYLNTAGGSLVPGPMGFGCLLWDVELAEFNGNGRQDAVLSCTDYPTEAGVYVLFDNGTHLALHSAPAPGSSVWEIEVLDVNADGRTDVRTKPLGTGTATVWLSRGNGTFGTTPIANDDLAHAYRNTPKVIKVRVNDLASSAATLAITQPPRYGYLTNVDSRYEVKYVRTAPHTLTDTFVYRLTEAGLSDTATVSVKMKD